MADSSVGLELRSTIKKEGVLELSLARVPVAEPKADEVVVRVEAAPVNPSDLGLMFAVADPSTVKVSGSGAAAVVSATIPQGLMKHVAARMDQSLPVGNEGAGVVVRAGSSAEAQALMGKTVAVLAGAMYAQFRTVKANQCLLLRPGTTPAEGASCFVNPLTALGMVETMRVEGHTALVHTAAASNLGQMLVKICAADEIGLVNVVRKPEQAELLRSIGATHVVDSSTSTFTADLTDAIAATGATLAFDAIGGGRTASTILACMEAALLRKSKGAYNRYGSPTHKQVYIYGGLDTGPTEINRSFGMTWSVGGWLLIPFLQKIGADGAERLRQRVADEIKTTFASRYTKEISLAEVLVPAEIAVYAKKATGEKYLINPNKSGA